jgi:hypothetical protein
MAAVINYEVILLCNRHPHRLDKSRVTISKMDASKIYVFPLLHLLKIGPHTDIVGDHRNNLQKRWYFVLLKMKSL